MTTDGCPPSRRTDIVNKKKYIKTVVIPIVVTIIKINIIISSVFTLRPTFFSEQTRSRTPVTGERVSVRDVRVVLRRQEHGYDCSKRFVSATTRATNVRYDQKRTHSQFVPLDTANIH